MDLILFDTAERSNLFPITLTRAIADIRTGILTVKERWERLIGAKAFVLTKDYLQPLYENIPAGTYVFIDARIIPTPEIVNGINSLAEGAAITDENGLVAGKANINSVPGLDEIVNLFKNQSSIPAAKRIILPHHIFQVNDEMIRLDYYVVTKKRISYSNNDTVNLTYAFNVFIEEGAQVNYCNLNASTGPIYIGKEATVMEGCFIRGPFALCEGAVLKMGSKIYGATTIGPYSTGGGEIKNSVITGFSNKAHDGYLGDSVIGEWCNLGAGTSNSNLKNNAGEVNLWNYSSQNYLPAGNKCGVIMGDYSRTGINTSINTGTVIGVSCNVLSEGLPAKHIPDFTWNVRTGTSYEFEKALRDILNWKKMKNKILSEQETKILKHIFDHYRE